MKAFVVFVVFFVCIFAVATAKGLTTEEKHEIFRHVAQKCKNEAGATDADIEGIISQKPASTKNAKCMRSCLMKEFEVMDADGKFVKDTAMKIADIHTRGDPKKMAIAEEISETCKNIAVSDDHCEAAEQYGHCALTEAHKRGITTIDF